MAGAGRHRRPAMGVFDIADRARLPGRFTSLERVASSLR